MIFTGTGNIGPPEKCGREAEPGADHFGFWSKPKMFKPKFVQALITLQSASWACSKEPKSTTQRKQQNFELPQTVPSVYISAAVYISENELRTKGPL